MSILVIAFCYIMEVTYWIFPLGLGLFTIIFPCKPPLLSALFFSPEECGAGPALQFKIIFSLVEFIIARQAVMSGGYYAVFILLPSVIYLWTELAKISDVLANFDVFKTTYEKLRVFETALNSATAGRIFKTIALVFPFNQIEISFTCIKLHQSGDVNLGKLAFFLLTYLDFLAFCLLVFTATAKINTLSKKRISQFGRKIKSKVDKKVMRGMSPLRIKFGDNFVEAITPLIIQEFCIRQLISLLIVSG